MAVRFLILAGEQERISDLEFSFGSVNAKRLSATISAVHTCLYTELQIYT